MTALRRLPPAVREALGTWALAFLAIIVAFLVMSSWAKLVATLCFLYLPGIPMRRRDEDFRDYGVTLLRWKDDLKLFGLMALLVLPVFALTFGAFTHGLELLPGWLHTLLAPYQGHAELHLRVPDRFGEWIIDQVFVVALPEEFFYRGFIQTRLADAWPQGVRILGARVGPAFLLTAVLFAVGHLAIFQFWRLGVVFPALLFGWMRERTGTVLGSTLFHALCNLTMLVLEASYYPGR